MRQRLHLRGPVQRLATVDSTNRIAAERAAGGAAEGLVVRADRQEHGRGRRERSWHSPPGGLWVSVLLRPPGLAGLSLAAGLACARAARRFGADASLRWPNDVYVGNRKLAGVLAEGRLAGSRVDWAVVGVGLNVNLGREDFPEELRDLATSLALEAGRPWDLDEVCGVLLDELDEVYERYVREGEAALLPDVEAACSTLGRRVRVVLDTGDSAEGRAATLRPDGALHLEDGRTFYSVERVVVLEG